MKRLLTTTLLCFGFALAAQDKIEWSEGYVITIKDFMNPGTEIDPSRDAYALSSGSGLEFLMQKNAYSFALSKNFNNTVTAIFSRSSAFIVAPDSVTANQLLNFARYSFDLTELYARKFRKRMNTEKETFSKSNFYQPIYEQVNSELNEELSRIMKLTDLGRKEELLKQEHEQVALQMIDYQYFCKSCKPPKRKKPKSN